MSCHNFHSPVCSNSKKSCWYPNNCIVCSGCKDLAILAKVIPAAEKLDIVEWLKSYNRQIDVGCHDDNLYGMMSNICRLWMEVAECPGDYACCITGRASVLLNGRRN